MTTRSTPIWVVALASAACTRAAEPTVTLEPTPNSSQRALEPRRVADTQPWTRQETAIGLGGDRVFFWDRERAGVRDCSAADGEQCRVRPITDLHINGEPSYWLPVRGGFVAQWDSPVWVRDAGATLSVGWRAPDGRWWGPPVFRGESMIIGRYRPQSSLVSLSLRDGSVEWAVDLPMEAQSVTLHPDGDVVYVEWTEYSPTAPTPQVIVPLRVRAFDVRGPAKALWTVDFAETPGRVAAARGVVLAAEGGDLHFIDGATGRTLRRLHAGRPNIYPVMLAHDGVVYVALNDELTAYSITTGEAAWRTPLAMGSGPELAIDEARGHILVTLENAGVTALSLADGARAWSLGLGLGGYRLWTSDAAAVLSGGATAGFALPVQSRSRAVTVYGHVTKVACGNFEDIFVYVGETKVKVDSTGAYSAEVEASSPLIVSLPSFARGFPGPAPLRIVLRDGQDRYQAPNLEADLCPRE
ncbi:MAG: PQQ-binding-like beta-propeller repeat protein [Polyangiaceae bacterium]